MEVAATVKLATADFDTADAVFVYVLPSWVYYHIHFLIPPSLVVDGTSWQSEHCSYYGHGAEDPKIQRCLIVAGVGITVIVEAYSERT